MSQVVTSERWAGALVARCHGALDLATRDALRTELPHDGELTAPGIEAVVVDLTAVPFMDCSALGVLAGLARECAENGTRFLFAGARPVVRRLLTTLEFDRIFVVAPGAADAVTLAATWTDVDGRPTPRPAGHPHEDRAARPAEDG